MPSLARVTLTLFAAVALFFYLLHIFKQSRVSSEYDTLHSENREKFPKYVLIITEARSGSTFLGELIATAIEPTPHQNLFYIYEPHESSPQKATFAMPVDNRLLPFYFDCSFLLAGFEVARAATWSPYSTVSRLQIPSAGLNTSTDYHSNKEKAYETCKSSSVMIKIITRLSALPRFPPSFAEDDDRLLVIHLLRDPRASVASASKREVFISKKRNESVVSYAEMICNNMLEKAALKTRKRRWITVKYEDLIDKPISVATKLLSAVGKFDPSRVEKFIDEHMNAPPDIAGDRYNPWRTYRNATAEMKEAWKKTLTGAVLAEVNGKCRDALRTLYPERL